LASLNRFDYVHDLCDKDTLLFVLSLII